MNYTIAKKLVLSFGLVLLTMVFSGVIVITQLRAIGININNIVGSFNPKNDAAYEMEINLIGAGFGLLGYLEDRDQEHLERIQEDINEFRQYHKIFKDLAKTIKSKELAIQISDQFNRYAKLAERIIRLEDDQDLKIARLYKNHEKMDDLLDNKIQMAVFSGNAKGISKLSAVMELEININGIAKGLGEYLRTHDSRYEARVMKDENDFAHFFKQYIRSELTLEEKEWARELMAFFTDSSRLTNDIIEINKLISSNRYEFVKVRRKMDAILDEGIQKITVRELTRTNQEAVTLITTTISLAVILLIFGLAVGIIAAIFISRHLLSSIGKLSSSAKSISKGDLTARVKIQSKDEIGELADTFNMMAEELSLAKQELESQKVILKKEIKQRTAELEESKTILEESVRDRTEQLQISKAGLEEKIAELEAFYDATVDRELKMEALRKRNNELESRL